MAAHETHIPSSNVSFDTILSTVRVHIPEVFHAIGLRSVVAAPVPASNTVLIRATITHNTSTLCTSPPEFSFFFTNKKHRTTRASLEML